MRAWVRCTSPMSTSPCKKGQLHACCIVLVRADKAGSHLSIWSASSSWSAQQRLPVNTHATTSSRLAASQHHEGSETVVAANWCRANESTRQEHLQDVDRRDVLGLPDSGCRPRGAHHDVLPLQQPPHHVLHRCGPHAGGGACGQHTQPTSGQTPERIAPCPLSLHNSVDYTMSI